MRLLERFVICPPAQAIVNHAFSLLKPGGDSLQQNRKIKPFSFLFCRKSCRSIGGRVQVTVRERTSVVSITLHVWCQRKG